MALNGNGSYSPPAPQFPAIPNTVIHADDFNQIILDIATALSTAIFRDGQAAFTADQSMGGFRLRQVGNAVADTDAPNLGQIKAIFDFYVGPSATDPLTRTDGSPLQAGDLYFNTTSARLYTFDGASWTGLSTITVWGTPRTFTVGNTGKSVDGSADVSWTLDEIGAARIGSLADGTDLNKVVSAGFYRIQDNPVNAPEGVSYGQLIVSRGNGDSILQIATGYANGEIYWRQGNPPDAGGRGSWSAWRKFFHSGNISTANAGTAAKLQTARTLTIGNTGKAFDGSANVSWSLDEIGAVRCGLIANGTDLNAVVTPGLYKVEGSHANQPPGAIYGQLIVSRNGDTVLQILAGITSNNIYWRSGYRINTDGSGQWYPWREFYHSGNLNWDSLPGKPSTFTPSAHTHSFSEITSGTTYASLIVGGTASDWAWPNGLQIRERSGLGTNVSAWEDSPRITFHWGNRVVKNIGLRSDGLMAIENDPIALYSNLAGKANTTGAHWLEHLWGGDSAGPIDLWGNWGPGIYYVEFGIGGDGTFANVISTQSDITLTLKDSESFRDNTGTTYPKNSAKTFRARKIAARNTSVNRIKNIWRLARTS